MGVLSLFLCGKSPLFLNLPVGFRHLGSFSINASFLQYVDLYPPSKKMLLRGGPWQGLPGL
jgi:hypothetical protein